MKAAAADISHQGARPLEGEMGGWVEGGRRGELKEELWGQYELSTSGWIVVTGCSILVVFWEREWRGRGKVLLV